MATQQFSYTPQRVLTEGWDWPVTIVEGVSRHDAAHRITTNQKHKFTLELGPLDDSTVGSIAAFYDGQLGPLEPFVFLNPNDQVSYFVRFDSALSRQHIVADLQRTGRITLTEVTS